MNLAEAKIVTRIEHYKWMLETMKLNPVHRSWIEAQINKLEAK
jgi:hypothetical protein